MEKIKGFINTYHTVVRVVVLVLALSVFGFGVYQSLTYSWPMYKGDYKAAYSSSAADKAIVLYDAGLAAYQNGDLENAHNLLTKAYSALNDSKGTIPESRKYLGSQVQFLLGNTKAKMKKVPEATEAYQQALRLDPTNLYAKYNLELLQSQPGGAGGSQGDPKGPGGQGSGGGKKGI